MEKIQVPRLVPAAQLPPWNQAQGSTGSPAEGSSATQTLTQVALPGDERGAVRTLVLGGVLAVLLHDVYFHGAALGEALVAHVAFVGLLACRVTTKTTLGGGASPRTPRPPPPRTLGRNACLLFPGPLLQPLPPMSTPN